MLMFSLGPVQTFIAQARKTRDLWLGSFILSTLMHAGMKDIEEFLVYPTDTTIKDDIPDIPNKYVAIFNDLTKAQEAAKQSKAKIAQQWQAICDAVREKIIGGRGDEITSAIWKRQTTFNALFDTYWVIVERKKEQKYGNWLGETERILAARKRLRDFKPQDEPGEKSGISGEREILRREGTKREDIQNFWKAIAATRSENDLDKDGTEHLDAVDLVKRFAMLAKDMPQKPFPSTSSIATASFVEGLLTVPLDAQALTTWREATGGKLVDLPIGATKAIPYLQQRKGEHEWLLRRDGDLYFLETFTAYRLEKEYNITQKQEAQERAENGRYALRQLLKATNDKHISRPTPYYATIQMDGDNMGILLNEVKHETEEHRNISAALSKFSRETAPLLVQNSYPGKLVYTGGDDVLAFAPLARDVAETSQPKHVLDLVDRLQAEYRKKVIDALLPPGDEERMKNITASTGIVIAHHYTSLSYVLRSAREAESLAKKRYGRNALVVTVIRRSGEQTRVGCHWHYDGLDDNGQPIALFSKFYTLFKHDSLSPKCVYILLEEAPTLVGLSEDAQASEIKRVLQRQYDKERDKQYENKADIPGLAKHIAKLAKAMDDDVRKRHTTDKELEIAVELHSDETRYGIVETLGWLLVMAFLARKDRE